MVKPNLIAIGRSRYLYDGIKYLVKKGFSFKAIVTEKAYDEYDIKHSDFEQLSKTIHSEFFILKSLDDEKLFEIIKSNNIKLAISANWKYRIPIEILNLFENGILNFHLGNLPDYKGNATVNWSIINKEKYIYGNVHKMDTVLDAGDVISRCKIEITSNTYIADILNKAEAQVPLLYEEAIDKIIQNPKYYLLKGTEEGLRCYPRLPQDSQINWRENADCIYRLIRASSRPYKGAYTYLNGEKIFILKAKVVSIKNKILAIPGHIIEVNKSNGSLWVACGEGILELETIESKGEIISPIALTRSIRVRFNYVDNG